MEKATKGEASSSTPVQKIKIDEVDAPYLDLPEDWELERCMMIKDREFINTCCFDPKTLMEMETENIISEGEMTMGWTFAGDPSDIRQTCSLILS